MRIDQVKLITAMARAELNVNQLAEKAGLSRGTVTAVKGGKRYCAETERKLVAVLGEDILDGKIPTWS